MQSNTPQPKTERPEQFFFNTDANNDVWISAEYGKELAKASRLKDVTPESGRRIELNFPDSINVVSKVFLFAYISEVCNNFPSFEQFREVVRIKADPITTRDFWNVVREYYSLEPIKPDPWYKRLLNTLR